MTLQTLLSPVHAAHEAYASVATEHARVIFADREVDELMRDIELSYIDLGGLIGREDDKLLPIQWLVELAATRLYKVACHLARKFEGIDCSGHSPVLASLGDLVEATRSFNATLAERAGELAWAPVLVLLSPGSQGGVTIYRVLADVETTGMPPARCLTLLEVGKFAGDVRCVRFEPGASKAEYLDKDEFGQEELPRPG